MLSDHVKTIIRAETMRLRRKFDRVMAAATFNLVACAFVFIAVLTAAFGVYDTLRVSWAGWQAGFVTGACLLLLACLSLFLGKLWRRGGIAAEQAPPAQPGGDSPQNREEKDPVHELGREIGRSIAEKRDGIGTGTVLASLVAGVIVGAAVHRDIRRNRAQDAQKPQPGSRPRSER